MNDGPYIIVDITRLDENNRIPRESNVTQLHRTYEEARQEANRLATSHNRKYAIFQFQGVVIPRVTYDYSVELKLNDTHTTTNV